MLPLEVEHVLYCGQGTFELEGFRASLELRVESNCAHNIGSEEKIASTITSVDQAVIADHGLDELEELD